jgi:uncharacterized RDD family membrane protein YckC
MPPWAPAGTQYAGFWIRVAANVLDGLILSAINTVIVLLSEGWLVSHLPSGVGSVSRPAPGIELGPVVAIGFIIGSWIAFGATPGKMMCRLRIVDEASGRKPTPWQCIGRYVLAVVGVACAGIGYLWIAIDPRRQGWHDKIVRTLVVHRGRAA